LTTTSQFDEIAEGDKQWTAILKTFYKKFHPSVENTLAAKTAHKAGERILGTDPVSGKQVSVKIGRFGPVAQIGTAEDEEKPRFGPSRPLRWKKRWSCSNFPVLSESTKARM